LFCNNIYFLGGAVVWGKGLCRDVANPPPLLLFSTLVFFLKPCWFPKGRDFFCGLRFPPSFCCIWFFFFQPLLWGGEGPSFAPPATVHPKPICLLFFSGGGRPPAIDIFLSPQFFLTTNLGSRHQRDPRGFCQKVLGVQNPHRIFPPPFFLSSFPRCPEPTCSTKGHTQHQVVLGFG